MSSAPSTNGRRTETYLASSGTLHQTTKISTTTTVNIHQPLQSRVQIEKKVQSSNLCRILRRVNRKGYVASVPVHKREESRIESIQRNRKRQSERQRSSRLKGKGERELPVERRKEGGRKQYDMTTQDSNPVQPYTLVLEASNLLRSQCQSQAVKKSETKRQATRFKCRRLCGRLVETVDPLKVRKRCTF